MHLPFALWPICCFYFYLAHTACSKLSKVSLCLFSWCPKQQDLKIEASCACILSPLSSTHCVTINWANNIHKRNKVLRVHRSSSKPQCHWKWASFSRWCPSITMKYSHWSLATKGENCLCYEHKTEVRMNAFRLTLSEEIIASGRKISFERCNVKARF